MLNSQREAQCGPRILRSIGSEIPSMKKFLLPVIVTISLITSCSKDNDQPATADQAQMQALTAVRLQSDAFFDDVSTEVLQVNPATGTTTSSTCAVITVSPQDLATWPKTITIDYGSTGCTGINGFVRKGKITYTISKDPRQAGATVSVSFDNYSVNGYKLEGAYTITNNGSQDGGLNLTTSLVNGKITYPDGRWYTRNSTVNWVQTGGVGTPLIYLDDEYSITGTATIRNSAGDELVATSRTPLLRTLTCVNTVSGQLDVVYNGISGVLDFGSGSCDKKAVLTVGSRTYDIVLP